DGDLLVETGPLTIPAPRGVNTSRALLYGTAIAMGALIPLSALQNIDVVIVGRLNPHEVGAWAAIATACKVPVFLGLAVANFLLPEAARRHHDGESATNALLAAMAWVATPGLVLVGVALVDPRWLLSTVFGAELAGGASALWILALAMTFLANTLLFTNYLLGVGERRIVPVVVVGVVVTAGALELAGGNLEATAVVGLVCESVLALAAGAMVVFAHPAARNRIRAVTERRPAKRSPEPAYAEANPAGGRAGYRPDGYGRAGYESAGSGSTEYEPAGYGRAGNGRGGYRSSEPGRGGYGPGAPGRGGYGPDEPGRGGPARGTHHPAGSGHRSGR
ncbi:MAG: hypothetical protein ACQSGP_28020, partial [Frankia sp.]